MKTANDMDDQPMPNDPKLELQRIMKHMRHLDQVETHLRERLQGSWGDQTQSAPMQKYALEFKLLQDELASGALSPNCQCPVTAEALLQLLELSITALVRAETHILIERRNKANPELPEITL